MGYQSQAPNMLAVVEECARKYPRAFNDCHRPERGDRAWAFIRLLAATLHEYHDERWGMNGKYGDPGNPSWDALGWNVPSPAGCDIFDVVGRAGAADQYPAWGDATQQTLDKGHRGVWIKPPRLADLLADEGENPAGPPPPPPPDEPERPENPGTPPAQDVATTLHQILGRLETVEAQVRASNSGIGGLTSLINDNFTQLFHTALANERKRIFGVLDEGGVTHPGVAEEAARLTVEALYQRNSEAGGALRVKVDAGNLGGLFGGRRE